MKTNKIVLTITKNKMSLQKEISQLIEIRKSPLITFEKEENGLIYKIQYDLKSQHITMFSVKDIQNLNQNQKEIISLQHAINSIESYIEHLKNHTIEIKKDHALYKLNGIESSLTEEEEIKKNEDYIKFQSNFLDELKKELLELKI